MSLDGWNPSTFQTQLRTTNQRLGQLQSKKDTSTQAIASEIADLLRHGNTNVARSKARLLLREDASAKLLEVLEMHVGVVSGHVDDLSFGLAQSPAMVEAAASVIYAAPRTESTDLNMVRGVLIDRLGPDFARSAMSNSDSYVSPHILRALAVMDDVPDSVDHCLEAVARQHDVPWHRPLRLEEKQNTIYSMLDTSSRDEVIHIDLLKQVSAQGLPHDPSWMRPRVWRLTAENGTLAKQKWRERCSSQRQNYYELVTLLLQPVANLPDPTIPLSPPDRLILNIRKTLLQTPPALIEGLDTEPLSSHLSPLDCAAPEMTRIAAIDNLDARIAVLVAGDGHENMAPTIPEIRLHGPATNTVEEGPTMIHASPGHSSPQLHAKHWTALVRLLFIHASMHPGTQSPHIVSLLIPIYRVLSSEPTAEEAAHAEADTFWLFQHMISEFSDLEDSELGTMWMHRLSQRLLWADPELFQDLHRKGLDPALPHYSYRWLAAVLAHTLPFDSLVSVWDVLFALPTRERDTNPKIERLVDICTSMLIRARYPLFRLGKSGRRSPSLWKDDPTLNPPPSPSRAWELGDAFNEGIALLQSYPIADAGGITRILETAAELARRRELGSQQTAPDTINTLGTRLKDALWWGFNGPQSRQDDSSSEEETEDEPEVEEDGERSPDSPVTSPGFGAMFKSTVWRGITNQSAMEVPPTPMTPTLPSPRPSPLSRQDDRSETRSPLSSKPASSNLWSYAQKLGDSDTVAKLAKTSTNWRVMALETWSTRKAGGSTDGSRANSPAGSPVPPPRVLGQDHRGSFPVVDNRVPEDRRRGSLPDLNAPANGYAPPTRPKVFKPPRDSVLFMGDSPVSHSSSPASPDSEHSESGFLSRGKNLQASLAALTGLSASPAPKPAATPRSGPRPLLLNSSSLITAHTEPTHSRTSSMSHAPPPLMGHGRNWSEAGRPKSPQPRHDSHSSISSHSSHPESHSHLSVVTSDGDSDTPRGGSRIVSLNRRSVSPMAPRFRHSENRSSSISSTTSSGGPGSPVHPFAGVTMKPDAMRKVYELRDERPDSPATLGSSSPPQTPVQPADSLLHQSAASSLKSPVLDVQPPSPSTPPTRSPRIRSKRHVAPKVANLQLGSISSFSSMESDAPTILVENPDSLLEHEPALTPRAAEFEMFSEEQPTIPADLPPRLRKSSTESTSTDKQRVRRLQKVSGGEVRDSISHASSDGDDEGYDDILSSYDSEEERRQALETQLAHLEQDGAAQPI